MARDDVLNYLTADLTVVWRPSQWELYLEPLICPGSKPYGFMITGLEAVEVSHLWKSVNFRRQCQRGSIRNLGNFGETMAIRAQQRDTIFFGRDSTIIFGASNLLHITFIYATSEERRTAPL